MGHLVSLALVQEAVQREFKRGGQVYFLHNEVDTIERQAQTLEALIPEARVQVAHGQLRKRDLDLRFFRDLADPAQRIAQVVGQLVG